MSSNRSIDWFKQAQSDLAWAKSSLEAGHLSQTCFVAQQVAEKALKALAYHLGYEVIRGHSVKELANRLSINDELENMAKKLDLYYISSRYPDAFPSGSPSEYFTKDQAEEAISFAEKFIDRVRGKFN